MDATADDIKALSLSDPKLCQALNLSDSKPCRDPATNINELFCRFHARQCFGLYKGYKRRNAELDSLARKEPAFLRRSKTSLINQNFDAVVDEKELQEIHSYLFTQSVLLRKVITARNVHHTHFYPQKMDYGHKAYLDKLVTRHQAVQKALGSLERRTAELVFKKEKWYDWVSKAQDEEEANREKEQQKVKLEADLFRRHWRGMEARLKAAREREEKRRQEAYLEEVWRERMASQDSSDESDTDWDPIEDVYQDNREKFLDLIRHFLWMEMPTTEATDDTPRPGSPRPESPRPETEGNLDPVHLGEPSEPAAAAELTGGDTVATAIDDSTTQKKRRRGKNKGKPQKSKTGSPVSTVASGQKTKNDPASKTQESQPDKSNIESMEEVRQRLREGVAKDYSHVRGPMVVGTSQIPHELYERTAPVAEEDIQRLMSEITEIKLLLFCRQLLSHPKLLPAALRAADIDDFLSDTSISEADLRDLCLRVERPSLQALRDACADFARGDEPDDDDDDEEPVYQSASQSLRHHIRYSSLEDEGCLPGTALLDGMLTLNMRTLLDGSGPMNGDLREEAKEQKMKIKVCGKSIWNHASQSSMARDGWLHFSIMAKDCSFHDAMSLCRNWDEFFDLHILAGWQYFPASRWTTWSGSMLMEELISMVSLATNILPLTQRAPRPCTDVVDRQGLCAFLQRYAGIERNDLQPTSQSLSSKVGQGTFSHRVPKRCLCLHEAQRPCVAALYPVRPHATWRGPHPGSRREDWQDRGCSR
jgi:AcrR family transcriptional regulator